MPAPRITTDLPAPEPWGSSGGPAHASGRLISPSAVIVSYIAAEPPAKPTCSRKRRRVTPFFFLIIWVSPVVIVRMLFAAGAREQIRIDLRIRRQLSACAH